MTRRTETRTTTRAALGLAAALLLGGCASATPIGELLDDPFAHDGDRVTIEGRVLESVGFLGPGFYRVEDVTGTLPVVNEEGGAPRSGSRIRVRGTFRAAFTLGDRAAAVLVEEDRETP